MKVLLQNAVTSMICNNFQGESYDDLAENLGSSVEELIILGIIEEEE